MAHVPDTYHEQLAQRLAALRRRQKNFDVVAGSLWFVAAVLLAGTLLLGVEAVFNLSSGARLSTPDYHYALSSGKTRPSLPPQHACEGLGKSGLLKGQIFWKRVYSPIYVDRGKSYILRESARIECGRVEGIA